MACFLGDLVNAENGNGEAKQTADLGKVARIALIHDLAESLVTDLPRQATEIIGRDAKHSAEKVALGRILDGATGGEKYANLWLEYEAGTSLEARIVRDADKLEMVMQARAYASSGNIGLDEFWQGHAWNFAASRRLFDRLLAERAERTRLT